MAVNMQEVYVFIMCACMYLINGVLSEPNYLMYRFARSVLTMYPNTTEVAASSDLQCGRLCYETSNCGAFYFRQPAGPCRHVITDYNYIDVPFQATSGAYDFFYKTPTPDMPWLFCPSNNEAMVITSSLHLTFRIIKGVFSHIEASEACTNDGQKLMKIATAEKQDIVAKILNSCPDLSSHDYWIDGYKNQTEGWLYADGSSVPMNNVTLWDTEAPNNSNNNSGCCIRMRYNKEHRWDDYDCSAQRFSYLCEPI